MPHRIKDPEHYKIQERENARLALVQRLEQETRQRAYAALMRLSLILKDDPDLHHNKK